MKTLCTIVIASAFILAASATPALADGDKHTATVQVTISVLPYAEINLYQTRLDVIIPAGQTTYGPIYIGGAVICNCPVILFARITKPLNAPGDWEAVPNPGEINDPGVHPYDDLLGIMIRNIPPGLTLQNWPLNVNGKKAGNPGGVVQPPAGEATITVVPK